jgi:hypothetical protein
MVNLNDNSSEIKAFILDGIAKFDRQEGDANSVGIYACPWGGWISLNFNKSKTLESTFNNCPDFEFVEFDLLEIESWGMEYGSSDPMFIDQSGNTYTHNHDDGDDALNGIFFQYLEDLIKNTRSDIPLTKILLQMLDSSYSKVVV